MKKTANSSTKKDVPPPPKRPLNGYFRYSNDQREQFKKKNPELTHKEIMKAMSVEWNKMTEAQQKKYNDAYEKEKVKYEAEKKTYEEKYGVVKPKKKESTKEEGEKRGRKATKK